MAKNKFYTRFNRPPKIVSENYKPSLTNQQFKNECDINYIISHCTQDSLAQRLNLANSSMKFGEMLEDNQPFTYFTNLRDYENEFNLLPPDIRKEYNMSFKNFLMTVADGNKNGIKKAVDLGILPKSMLNVEKPVDIPTSQNVDVSTVTENVVIKENE